MEHAEVVLAHGKLTESTEHAEVVLANGKLSWQKSMHGTAERADVVFYQ